MSSVKSSSLAMRSSPHDGFSFPIRRMSLCNSSGIGGRPGWDCSRQNNFRAARCHRIIVSGPTTTSASRQSQHFESIVSETRVTGSIRRGIIPRSVFCVGTAAVAIALMRTTAFGS
jgi:hypothetical protein